MFKRAWLGSRSSKSLEKLIQNRTKLHKSDLKEKKMNKIWHEYCNRLKNNK